MTQKPTYEELEYRVKVLEKEAKWRKQAEEALHASEAKYRSIFENIQDVFYEANFDGIITEISPSIEYFSQYKREELIGKSLYDIYTDRKQRDEFINEILNNERVTDYEIQLTDKDGSQYFCSLNAKIIRDEQGNPIKVVGSVRDISERKRAEEALRRQNEYWEALHEISLGLLQRLSLNELLQDLLRRVCKLANTPNGFIYLLDPEQNDLEFKVGCGSCAEHAGLRIKPGEGLSGKVWHTKKSILIEDYHNWPDRSLSPEFDDIHSILGVPLKSNHRIKGVIGLAHSDREKKIGAAEIEMLERFAEIASFVLDHVTL